MPKVTVITRSGEERVLEVGSGVSLMEALRNSGFDEVLALCGGCCSCATCHVHLDPQTFSNLPTMTEDENDLLDSASDRDATSRLSCQVAVDELPDGARVRIAEED